MALNILGPLLFSISQVDLIWADPSEGMDRPDLTDAITPPHT